MSINASWHEAHPMPKNPSLQDRVAWHVEHTRECACRAMPDTVTKELDENRFPPHELPSIGMPATRALMHRGITSPEQLARFTEAEVAAWHGVGPKAIRILKEAMVQKGKAFLNG
jgi:predicted flap endonuclease-1-like 5' DNA nuclease